MSLAQRRLHGRLEGAEARWSREGGEAARGEAAMRQMAATAEAAVGKVAAAPEAAV
jgi:hypothetical protein